MNLAPGHMLLVDDNNKGLTIFAHKTSTFKFRNFFKLIKREGEILPEARRYIFINFDLTFFKLIFYDIDPLCF